ncbi:MAG: lytic transglycosylase domain-containing protein [Halothiobacillaceae bacterium]
MDLPTLYAQCAPNVAPQTLAAIVRVESGGKPWAIGVNGDYVLPRQPQSKDEAVREANRLIALGYNIDMGMMQINVKNLPMLNLSVDQVFDPCTNITAGAQILQNFYLKSAKSIGQGQTSLHRAISAYNTGNFSKGFANGYVAKVTQQQTNSYTRFPASTTEAMKSAITVSWQAP